ncbi:MFS transporter [Streptomyces sp. NPDC004667]|uniref:MFS transporter n=1 Tax=Streptomyces sp. NPDC004667 TaxID=3154285 RepID=UPI0033A1B7D1
MSVFSLFGAMGYSLGLVLGGLLTGFGWRYVFLMPAPLSLPALVVGWKPIPKDRPVKTGGHDPAGAIAMPAAFVLIEKRVRHPLVRLGILRHTSTIRADLSIVALVGSYTSFQFMLTLFLQDGRGRSPLRTAFALLPVGAALVLAVLTGLLGGAGHNGGTFTPYRPGLNLITAVAAAGLLLNLIPRRRLHRR